MITLTQAGLIHAWLILRADALFWLIATLLAWHAAEALSARLRHPPYAAPPIVAILLLLLVLWATGTDYPTYMRGGAILQFLLGPATVALALPLYANLARLRRPRVLGAVLISLLAGSLVTCASALLVLRAFGAPDIVLRSMVAKSVTVPIAIGIAGKIGALPPLTAAFVMMTALITVPLMGTVFRALRLRDPAAQGLAAGTVAHGVATARMLTLSTTGGAFGSLAIGLNAIATALYAPLLLRWLGH